MVNFYRRFLRDAALILKPLTDALKGQAKGQLNWTADMAAAFKASKSAMLNAVELAHPQRGAELELAVDPSGSHCGAVLHRRVAGGRWQPLAYFSVKLDQTQQLNSTFDRELPACYLAVRYFRFMLEGRAFYILTDHEPLFFALKNQ